MAQSDPLRAPDGATGALVLASGDIIWGKGFGAEGHAVGEVCFNTAMTGYQEVMTDPSYARQIITFTFPHIGNVGVNAEDVEADTPHALGCVVREDVTAPSNFRSAQRFDEWMKANGRIGLAGVDTRALTRRIREQGAPNAVIAHSPAGNFDIPALVKAAQDWSGLEGLDLAKDVTREETGGWNGGAWTLGQGYAEGSPSSSGEGFGKGESAPGDMSPAPGPSPEGEGSDPRPHVVAIDYGAKKNILRRLVNAGARVTVVAATASYDEIMALKPDGVFLSNGPGDPAATADYAVPVIKQLLDEKMPIFGICLGHQLLGLAAGAKTAKMFQGHRGANHPVQRKSDGRVEITSMNHGFAVDVDTLPDNVEATHISLFDGTLCGLSFTDRTAFGVQYHPEASPGPMDSDYLFENFVRGLG